MYHQSDETNKFRLNQLWFIPTSFNCTHKCTAKCAFDSVADIYFMFKSEDDDSEEEGDTELN